MKKIILIFGLIVLSFLITGASAVSYGNSTGYYSIYPNNINELPIILTLRACVSSGNFSLMNVTFIDNTSGLMRILCYNVSVANNSCAYCNFTKLRKNCTNHYWFVNVSGRHVDNISNHFRFRTQCLVDGINFDLDVNITSVASLFVFIGDLVTGIIDVVINVAKKLPELMFYLLIVGILAVVMYAMKGVIKKIIDIIGQIKVKT